MRVVRLSLFLFLTPLLHLVGLADDVAEAKMVRGSLVRIEVSTQNPSFRQPWQSGLIGSGVGTGFLIEGNLIMTNAHVVSNATSIKLMREGSSKTYLGRVAHVAHDCDLALLTVDSKEFFEDTATLDFGTVPDLNSTVAAYGYPVGGQHISITKGVVSRIQFQTYSHSGADAHLAIQVDAAINPGNSGGPVVQKGKVVGVAFQGFSGAVAQNTAYMIPTPVIRRFLKDVEDGKYDGYVDLSISYMKLENPSQRAYLGLADGENGVLVTSVLEEGSAGGSLQEGDVLLRADGRDIDLAGNINIGGENVLLDEIAERKFYGDKVTFEVWRDRKKMNVEFRLKGAIAARIFSKKFDQMPKYVLFAGLLFQPLNRNVLGQHRIQNKQVQYYYSNFVTDEIYLKRPELIVLTAVLGHPVNTGYESYAHHLVDEINGVKIKRLADVAAAFDKETEHHVIRVLGQSMPIVLDAKAAAAARAEIMQRYNVPDEQYLGEEGGAK